MKFVQVLARYMWVQEWRLSVNTCPQIDQGLILKLAPFTYTNAIRDTAGCEYVPMG